MSTIAVTNVKHPSAVDPAIVLDADGGVSVAGMGLVHIATESFSAVSSVSLNDVFNSLFANYLLIFDHQASGTTGVNLRGRTAGVDDSSSNYQTQIMSAASTTVSGSRAANATSTEIFVGRTTKLVTVVFFGGANLAAAKSLSTGQHDFVGGNVAEPAVNIRGIGINVSTQYDGFTIFPNSGTITGTIRVYGYANS